MSTRWLHLADDDHVAGYDRRTEAHLAEVAAAGRSVHGEADLVDGLLDRQGDVLDLGCGTGRVAWRLAELGHRVVGVDLDPRMLGSARARDAEVAPPTWVTDDLTAYRGEPVDVVLLAGNVVPLVGSDHLQVLTRAVVHHLRPGALLVSGFGLDEEHLPDGCPVMPLTDLDRACDASGLQLLARWGTWHGEPLTGDYAVSVHTLSR
ncbi:class I SAM-dependent methyltransferase [Ornithinimicrobium sediminis]|uniref:class I SAM-dependent methyltransferase n=1 Tax=Ornithinimicrobium sediminis TaxID=2904603 RepID=UPI001E3FA837|nr:methyltransferase domain-containing protein [Ornithinimicrobium sediminis]